MKYFKYSSLLKIVNCFLLLLLFIEFSISDLIDREKDFLSLPGIQIYMFENTQVFGYFTINNDNLKNLKGKNINELNGSLTIYTRSSYSELSTTGIWTAIGFGSSKMHDSDIILCGMNKDYSLFCQDFLAVYYKIMPKLEEEQTITMYDSEIINLENIDGNYACYLTKIKWDFTRKIKNLNEIIKGNEKAISAWGHINDFGIPKEHHLRYEDIGTGDGNQKEIK